MNPDIIIHGFHIEDVLQPDGRALIFHLQRNALVAEHGGGRKLLQLFLAYGLVDGFFKTCIGKRLTEEVGGIQLESVNGILRIGRREDEENTRRKFLGKLYAVDAPISMSSSRTSGFLFLTWLIPATGLV